MESILFRRSTWRIEVNQNIIPAYLQRKRSQFAFAGPDAFAGFYIKLPLVDWTNNNTAFLFTRVQDAAHVRTDIVYCVKFAVDIVYSDIIPLQLYRDTIAGGHAVHRCRFHVSRRFLTHRC